MSVPKSFCLSRSGQAGNCGGASNHIIHRPSSDMADSDRPSSPGLTSKLSESRDGQNGQGVRPGRVVRTPTQHQQPFSRGSEQPPLCGVGGFGGAREGAEHMYRQQEDRDSRLSFNAGEGWNERGAGASSPHAWHR